METSALELNVDRFDLCKEDTVGFSHPNDA